MCHIISDYDKTISYLAASGLIFILGSTNFIPLRIPQQFVQMNCRLCLSVTVHSLLTVSYDL